MDNNLEEIVEKYWVEIPEHFPFVKLDAFVMMPNHIHGIIEIAQTDNDRNAGRNIEMRLIASLS